jgi:hypothetical protein
MKFFDQKQDVLDIIVTPYGKYLLSQGSFDPHYYGFFDDDILYSLEWSSGTGSLEKQNDIEDRIQTQTPRMLQPSVYTGVETTVEGNMSVIRSSIATVYGAAEAASIGAGDGPLAIQDTITDKIYNQQILQPTGDQYEFLSSPLGSSDLSSNYYPSWGVSMLKGEITSSAHYYAIPKYGGTNTPVGHRIEHVPQINITCSYQAYVGVLNNASTPGSAEVLADNSTSVSYSDATFEIPDGIEPMGVSGEIVSSDFSKISSEIFSDGTFIALEDGRIVLDVVEHNSHFRKENFEIEVFMSSSQVSDADGSPKLLYFANSQLDLFSTDDVEKYMTLRVDHEINDARISGLPITDNTRLNTDYGTTNVVSTREFLVRDLYQPEEDICE